MHVNVTTALETHKRVHRILISQAKPQVTTQYDELEQRYGVKIDFIPFVTIQGLTEKEYRKQRVYPNDFTAIVFTSRNAVDHFFRLCEEMRLKIHEDTRYFCATETIANYIQKFVMLRKRKVFNGTRSITELKSYIVRHKNEKYFLPCNAGGNEEVRTFFKEIGVPIQEAEMYKTVNTDLKDLADVKYDILAFFSPLEINSLFENFPNFKQEDRRVCVFGKNAVNAINEKGMTVNIHAGTPEAPSIAVALENYMKNSNK